MELLSIEEIAKWVDGEIVGAKTPVLVSDISTDSRTLKTGDCFIALRGRNFDGMDFVADAVQKGAVAVVVDREPRSSASLSIPVIRVRDSLEALQRLARFYRKELKAKIVAITGSSGKTSTKEMVSSVLSQKYKTVCTSGNFNNQIGLPLSLLRMDKTTEYGVFELGTNHPGEIGVLAQLAAPDIVIITNIGSAHVGNFGSVDTLAKEKTDLLSFVSAKGVAILSDDDYWSKRLHTRSVGQVIWVGNQQNSVCWLDRLEMTERGIRYGICRHKEKFEVFLPTVSREMAKNSLFAAAVGFLSCLSSEEIAAGLRKTYFPAGRLTVHPIKNGFLIDDSYNANPESMLSALRALIEFPFPSKKIAIMGSMGELGSKSSAFHSMIGSFAGGLPLWSVILIGPNWKDMLEGFQSSSFPTDCIFGAEDIEEAYYCLRKLLNGRVTLLVKGSRFLKLDRIVEKVLCL
ncbi:UDP-N-acetylmuramoyl-tripeptide--D-alanyl-D-alanine ligase [Methylacidiphilum caldifontis]|uniref:UDP-N-acetylmuramoyl-tripeptide--D-alanyl-D- alanine ligase n=1 Tax=Methylacidiphilum caldifontis TaxID=2795386 RepID=UPI001A904610|nr:UDP-N-acetylmuramoyl-tripeptide--D-alanyl-D-alanine ligase [Methylacidiphilum caldifontis]QSR88724.1 UDP-N-acetylmuramoyl-tripeptide--D-alanyl-D-alanine ligase [Methylacidiphilum caldifontis]